MRLKEVFKTKQSLCGYYRANERVWREDYGTMKFDWLKEHKMICESKQRYVGESMVWEYYQFTKVGRVLQNWYNNSLGDILYYYVFHLYQFKIWWQKLMIKFGKRYAWQEYEDVDLNDI